MRLKLEFPIERKPLVGSHDKIALLGSCFSESMGKYFDAHLFDCCSNPFGIMYNPQSLAKNLRRVLELQLFHEQEFEQNKEVYHHWDLHSQCTSENVQALVLQSNRTLTNIHERLKTGTNHLIITFGTSWVYVYQNEVVANCHKYPSDDFEKLILETPGMIDNWESLLKEIKKFNSQIHVHCTISPVRHVRDGLIQNQHSKARLIELVHAIEAQGLWTYFPSFEIVLDELRDHRFYQSDLLHPNEQAIEYIWNRFVDTRMSTPALEMINAWKPLLKASQHRSLLPGSKADLAFKQNTKSSIENFGKKHQKNVDSFIQTLALK
jgi:hypothetical protein